MLLLSYDFLKQSQSSVLSLELLLLEDDGIVVSLSLLASDLVLGGCGICSDTKLFFHALLLWEHFTLVHVNLILFFITHGHVLSLDMLSKV